MPPKIFCRRRLRADLLPRKLSHLVVMMTAMTSQLRLLEATDVEWKLDERTKEIGRRGLAQARAALRAHAPIDDELNQATAA